MTSYRDLLSSLRSFVSNGSGLIITTLPRGGLQIAQPSNVPETLLRAYGERLHTEDRLTWHAVLHSTAVRLSDLSNERSGADAFVDEVMKPIGMQHAVAVSLSGPVLEGYAGAAVLFRTAEQGDFSSEDVAALKAEVASFERNLSQSRQERPAAANPAVPQRPSVSLAVFNSHVEPHTPGQNWNGLDQTLRTHMVEQAREQLQSLNGHESTLDRVNLVDSHGDQWAFNRVTYKRYPAISNGPVTFFCLQPDCFDWSNVREADLEADPELSRLIPAVKFMHAEYSRGPTLSEIAQQVKLSPFHFHRRFSELLGTTPKQYMLNCQIQKAKSELLAGTVLATIAKDCGFAHQSHFTSRFKQATGLTPTRWRRMALRRDQVSSN